SRTMDVLTLTTEGLFGVVFFWALVAWLRRRDPLSRDVLLVFAAMVAVFLLGLYQRVVGRPPQVVSVAAIGLLLGQPALTLRLGSRIHPIRRGVIAVAAAAWRAVVALLVIVGAAPIVLVAAIGCFVVTEAVAA